MQDASISAIDLTVVGSTFVTVGNCHAEWVRIKPVVATTAGSIVVWVRTDRRGA